MKKIISLFNDYLVSFWFSLLLLVSGCLLIVVFNPILIAISINYNTNLTGLINIISDFWTIFLLPLAVLSILISVSVWLKKDKSKNKDNYRGLSALIITLCSLAFSFLLITQLNNLNYLIQADAFHLKTIEPQLIVNPVVTTNQNEQAVINTVTEDSLQKLTNTPAEIMSVFNRNNKTYLSLDILSRNEKFVPGVNDFFINQSRRLREFSVDEKTMAYVCGVGPDGNATTADVIANTQDIINTMQSSVINKIRSIYYFDIESGLVKNIYQACLP